MKPYVICHMCSSLDGKIIGHRWGKLPGYQHESELFENYLAHLQAAGVSNAWRRHLGALSGRSLTQD
jgi:riboflavin biosynthesis pyrimidine reductase